MNDPYFYNPVRSNIMISCGKPKLLEVMLYNFMNYTINYIRSSMINLIILLNINQLHLLVG